MSDCGDGGNDRGAARDLALGDDEEVRVEQHKQLPVLMAQEPILN